MKRTAERAGIEREINVHMFRHYFGTKLISNGDDISVIKELMRHEDTSTTMKYVHLSEKVLKDHYDEYQENFER